MSSIAEIENAIEKLPTPQVDELAGWLETLRVRRATPASVESWLQRARGAAAAPREHLPRRPETLPEEEIRDERRRRPDTDRQREDRRDRERPGGQ